MFLLLIEITIEITKYQGIEIELELKKSLKQQFISILLVFLL